MILGRTPEGLIKTKTDGGFRAVECACCLACESDLIFQSLTASLPHYGYSPFSCDGSVSSDIRYLSISYSGLATSYCGGYPKHGPASRTYTIDPVTGLTSISGDSEPRFWCEPGSRELEECSPTSRTWNCGSISDAEKALNCEQGTDEKTLTETLSQENSLSAVVSNVDQLLYENQISDSSMPPGVAATVVPGTGHSIINWTGTNAATCAYFFKGDGQVVKTKLRIKFPTPRSYKLISKDASGNVVSEETLSASAGQIIVVDPPLLPGYICVEPSCVPLPMQTSLECSQSIEHTTRRRVCRDPESNEEIPCPECGLFIGPDCKEYNTQTTTTTSSSSGSRSLYYSPFPEYSAQQSENYSTQSNYTNRTAPCLDIYTCAGNSSSDYSWDYYETLGEVDLIGSGSEKVETDLCTGVSTCTRVSTQGSKEGMGEPEISDVCLWTGPYVGANCTPSCNGTTSQTETTNRYDNEYGKCDFNTTVNRTSSISASGNTVSLSQTASLAGSASGCVETETTNGSASCITEIVYSNSDGSEEQGSSQWETDVQQGTFTGCVEKHKLPNYSTESNATISCTAKFTASQVATGESPKNYKTWFHYYTVEDSGPSGVETNLGAVGSRVRTVVAENRQVASTSSGGEVSLSMSPITLSTTEGKTKCLIGPVAFTYELPATN